jgi:putative membrane protein
MMMSGYAMQVVGWLLNVVLVLGLWALSVATIIAALRAWGGSDRAVDADASARRVLDDRFARGQIDDDEYVRERELLRSGH